MNRITSALQNAVNPTTYSTHALRTLAVFAVFLGAIVVVVIGYAPGHWAGGLGLVGFGVAIGAFLGVLFGMPLVGKADTSAKGLTTGNSFDQVVDWVTKILVGLTLTQLGGVPSKLQALAHYFAAGIGGAASDESVGLAFIVIASILGFMAGLVWSRLVFAPDLAAADADLRSRQTTAKDSIDAQATKSPALDSLTEAQKKQAAAEAKKLAVVPLSDGRLVGEAFAPESLLSEAVDQLRQAKKI